MQIMDIETLYALIETLYALSDCERFPSCSELARPDTPFYADFKVAEAFGLDGVKDTMKNRGDLTKRDHEEVTELYIVLNHLMWEAHRRGDNELMKYYKAHYDMIDDMVDSWDEDSQNRFYKITD